MDFETRSALKIKNVGGWIYSIHPSTDPICLAFVLDKADEPKLWVPNWTITIVAPWYEKEFGVPLGLDCPWLYPGSCPHDLKQAIVAGYEVEAHNAFFERAIWNNIMVPKFNWPKISENQWRCSAALAASYTLPRALENAIMALNLPFQKDMEGHRVMQRVSRPRKAKKAEKQKLTDYVELHDYGWENTQTKDVFYFWNEKPEDIFRTWEYCRQDVRAERSLSQTLAGLSPEELAVWRADQAINLRGIHIDRKMAQSALKIAAEAVNSSTKTAIEIATTGQKEAPFQTLGQRDKILSWIKKQGVNLPDLQKSTVDSFLKTKELPENVRIVLTAKKNVSKTSVRKYAKILETASPVDDRIRDVFMYHGAGTGRWSGKFVQTQNLVRGKMKDPDTMCSVIANGSLDWLETCYGPINPMEILSWAIRGAFCAPSGRDLIAADYSGVEARGLLWFVNDEKGLTIFRRPEGEPGIYREMASEIYKTPATEINTESVQRFVGKQAILGLGYGMGPNKFQGTCAQFGQQVDLEFSKFVVKTYREKFHKVVESWRRLENAAIKAVRNPKTLFYADKVTYLRKGGFLYCRLPSGRKLAYCRPVVMPSETPWGDTTTKLTYMTNDSTTHQWTRTDTYGGKLMENIIQGLCRDLEAYAIVKIENDLNNPYDIVMHTHDEIVCECDEGKGSVEEFEKIISSLPTWAKGFPLGAEGWRGKRYRK
jgi:DNA polymerase